MSALTRLRQPRLLSGRILNMHSFVSQYALACVSTSNYAALQNAEDLQCRFLFRHPPMNSVHVGAPPGFAREGLYIKKIR